MKMLGSPIIADDNHAEDRARATEGPEKGVDVAPEQSSYLSQISQIIFVEKKFHEEKFWEFFENFEKTWEILGDLATISCGEKLSPKVHL